MRFVRPLLLLTLVGCRGAAGGEGATSTTSGSSDAGSDDCRLRSIVVEYVGADAIDCSGVAPADAGGSIADCLSAALEGDRAAYWISELERGVDSSFARAVAVRSDGSMLDFYYDSHPGGGGSGADTVSVRDCPPFSDHHGVACDTNDVAEHVCYLGRRVT